MNINLKEKRKKLMLTQRKVAYLANISISYYAMLETRKRKPSVKLAQKLGEILQFPWEEFFNNTTNNTANNNDIKNKRISKNLSVEDICIITQIPKERYLSLESGLELPSEEELSLLKTILNF